MIYDKLYQFDPAGTAITSTAASTNVLDMLAARDMAISDQPGVSPIIVVILGAALTASGSATLTVQLQGSVDNSSWTIYCQTDAIPKANLTFSASGNNTMIKLAMSPQPPHAAGIPRYYRLNYVVATGPFTGGTVEAILALVAPQFSNPPSYATGFTVAN